MSDNKSFKLDQSFAKLPSELDMHVMSHLLSHVMATGAKRMDAQDTS